MNTRIDLNDYHAVCTSIADTIAHTAKKLTDNQFLALCGACGVWFEKMRRSALTGQGAGEIVPCQHCHGWGEIEPDNNGPIGPCPVCNGKGSYTLRRSPSAQGAGEAVSADPHEDMPYSAAAYPRLAQPVKQGAGEAPTQINGVDLHELRKAVNEHGYKPTAATIVDMIDALLTSPPHPATGEKS